MKTKKQIIKEINRIEKAGCQYVDSITKEKAFKLYAHKDDWSRIQTLRWVLGSKSARTKTKN